MSISIGQAVELLKQGEIVAFPTETVYGLGAPVFNESAVRKIFAAKKRPLDNPLIVHISSMNQVTDLAVDIPDDFYRLAEQFFPGPLTVVLKKNARVPDLVSAGLPTIALRMPAHLLARELIEKVGEPLAAPSANLSGRPSATEAMHVLEDFGNIPVLDGGETPLGVESTVILLGKEPVLLRPGTVLLEEIEAVLGKKVGEKTTLDPVVFPVSPGMKYRHYAPLVPLRVFTDQEEFLAAQKPGKKRLILQKVSAKTLYRFLRTTGYEEIVVFCDEEMLKDKALMDRLLRAASS